MYTQLKTTGGLSSGETKIDNKTLPELKSRMPLRRITPTQKIPKPQQNTPPNKPTSET